MNREQQSLFNKMKRLIKEGKKFFANRKDRDYLQDLEELGLSEADAWRIIESLNFHFYFTDPRPIYNADRNTLIFKRMVNENRTYIKLTLKKISNDEYTVCISFHKDSWR